MSFLSILKCFNNVSKILNTLEDSFIVPLSNKSVWFIYLYFLFAIQFLPTCKYVFKWVLVVVDMCEVLFYFLVLGVKLRTLCLWCRRGATEPNPQPCEWFYIIEVFLAANQHEVYIRHRNILNSTKCLEDKHSQVNNSILIHWDITISCNNCDVLFSATNVTTVPYSFSSLNIKPHCFSTTCLLNSSFSESSI